MAAPTVQDSLSALEQERNTAASRRIAAQVMQIHDLLRALDKLRGEAESAATTMLGYETTPANAAAAEAAGSRFRHLLQQLEGSAYATVSAATLVGGTLASARLNANTLS